MRSHLQLSCSVSSRRCSSVVSVRPPCSSRPSPHRDGTPSPRVTAGAMALSFSVTRDQKGRRRQAGPALAVPAKALGVEENLPLAGCATRYGGKTRRAGRRSERSPTPSGPADFPEMSGQSTAQEARSPQRPLSVATAFVLVSARERKDRQGQICVARGQGSQVEILSARPIGL